MIGTTVGNYRILAELGRGGMGVVYRAEHVQLGRAAAVKMLLPQLSSDGAIVQRFFNEARAASSIEHPGIVEVFDFGTHEGGSAYIVMPLLRGESLEARMRRAPLAPPEAATIIAQVAGALAAAHALGIVHRDLKPDNIFLVPNEMMPYGVQPKLLDFGIAKLAGGDETGQRTQTGMMMGTPAYMSPEQCMGKSDLDHRTDLYSLGCILFHLLGGRPPFVSDQGTGMIIAAHLRDPAPDVRTLNPSVPEPLVAIVRRLLEKDPAARFPTALALRDALVAAGADAPRSKPPQLASEAYGSTVMAGGTTQATAAGQVVAHAPSAVSQRSRKGGWLAAGALVLVAAGVGAAVVASRGDDDGKHEGARVATGSSAAAVASGSAPTSAIDAGATAVASTPCPAGLSRREDTHGQCCWPGQAYSVAKGRCVGEPLCPPGRVPRAESCEEPPAPTVLARADMAPPARPAAPVPPPHPDHTRVTPTQGQPATLEAPTFTVRPSIASPREMVTLAFAKPVPSPAGRRAWITIVDPSAGDADYGAWAFVDDGAQSMTIVAPDQAGTFEVRLHASYPQKPHDLRRRVRLIVSDRSNSTSETSPQDQRFVAATLATPKEVVDLHFPKPMRAARGEKFWVTVVAVDAPDTSYGAWEYVADGARASKLPMPDAPGTYELRLHANYPRKATNVVYRARIVVQ